MRQTHASRDCTQRNSGAYRHYSRSELTRKDDGSSTGVFSKVQGAIAKMKLVSNGIKMFTTEFQEIRALRESKGKETPGENGAFYNKKWSRREILMARRVSAAKARVALTAVVFTIPGGGFVVVGVLLGWPQYLTSHFWDDKMKEEFKHNEYAHKLRLQTAAKLGGRGRRYQNILENPPLEEQQRSFLREIAAYHGVINSYANESASYIFQSMLVSPWVQQRLLEKFQEIIADDALILRDSPSSEELTRDELQEACVERMLCSPKLSDESMRLHLGEWIAMGSSQKKDIFLLNSLAQIR
jgi:hypothetical protein